ncbi:MAG TPA: hypothetical protein VN641_01975 [Urbifossiella sp.]|nr:hypothetical protein [Urbifossiella sp.]
MNPMCEGSGLCSGGGVVGVETDSPIEDGKIATTGAGASADNPAAATAGVTADADANWCPPHQMHAATDSGFGN